MPRTQNARITVTLSGVATTEELQELEERIMSALNEAVAALRAAVEAAAGRLGDPGALEAAIAAERARYDALVAAEAAEDVAQDAELAAARGEVDRLITEQTGAAEELVTLADQLNRMGTAVDEAEPGTPVEDVVVPDEPVIGPDDTEPAPAPADDTAAPAPAPADDTAAPAPDEAPAEDVDTDVPPAPPADDTAAPAPADDTAAPAPDDAAGGPTDADGNPVDGPAV